jgi:elongation factor G
MPDGARSPGLVDIAIEPRETSDQGTLLATLRLFATEDPDIWVIVDEESGQIILSGRDEPHLDRIIERLKVDVAIKVGAPQVAYRETISKSVEGDYTHKGLRFGVAEFARIKFKIEPQEDGGLFFRSVLPPGSVPADFVAAVQSGVESVGRSGPIIGFPIIRARFTLLDAAHDKDSSTTAFARAAQAAFKEVIERAAPKVLEPIMRVGVTVPELYVGNVIGDLNSRRGQIRGTEAGGSGQVIDALVPMAGMFGYANSLHALSRGAGQYDMSFSHYEQVPMPFDPDDRFRPAMAMRA